MTDAFAYLLTRSAVNRVRSQVLRLRNPRYVAAFVAGGLYLWWFIFRPSAVPQQGGSLIGGSLAALAPLLLVVVLGGVWLFGGDRTALAFSPAEISFLLPAPVSRRGLLGFKLVRAQAAIVISSVIWVFILRRGSSSNSALLAALSFWVLFSTLAMHRLAAALVRASAAEHRGAAFRRHWLAIVLFGTVVVVLALEVIDSRAALRAASGLEGTLGAFASLLARPGARVVLAPFRAMLAPTLAGSAAEWVRAIPAALAILLLHAWWLFRTDTAFEEAAVEASARRAVQLERLRARRSAMPVAPTVSRGARTIPLAPTGWPALAIVWKAGSSSVDPLAYVIGSISRRTTSSRPGKNSSNS